MFSEFVGIKASHSLSFRERSRRLNRVEYSQHLAIFLSGQGEKLPDVESQENLVGSIPFLVLRGECSGVIQEIFFADFPWLFRTAGLRRGAANTKVVRILQGTPLLCRQDRTQPVCQAQTHEIVKAPGRCAEVPCGIKTLNHVPASDWSSIRSPLAKLALLRQRTQIQQ